MHNSVSYAQLHLHVFMYMYMQNTCHSPSHLPSYPLHAHQLPGQVVRKPLQSDLHHWRGGGQSHHPVHERYRACVHLSRACKYLLHVGYICHHMLVGTCVFDIYIQYMAFIHNYVVSYAHIPRSLNVHQLHCQVVLRPPLCVHHHWPSVGRSHHSVEFMALASPGICIIYCGTVQQNNINMN